MASDSHIRRIALFALRLAVIAPVVLALWWLCMPVYARAVGEISAMVLRLFGAFPIQRVVIHASGMLNTGTTLGFDLGDRTPSIEIAEVLTNLATFVSLVLATRRLNWTTRLGGLAAGLAVLVLSHVTYVVVFFAYAKTIARYPQIPTAIGQIFVTLPFLLWIVLAYWRTLQTLAGTSTTKEAEPKSLAADAADSSPSQHSNDEVSS